MAKYDQGGGCACGLMLACDCNDSLPIVDVREVKRGQQWKHRNGNEYVVLYITNLFDEKKYPKTVVYMNVNNETLWSRKYSDWHRSFTFVGNCILD